MPPPSLLALSALAWTPHLRMGAPAFPHSHIELYQTGPAPERSCPHPTDSVHVQPHASFLAVARSHPFYAEARASAPQPAYGRTEEEDHFEPSPSADVPDASEDVASASSDMLQIIVPDGVNPGDKLATVTPDGVKVTITVPEGAAPGTALAFAAPKRKE